MSTARAIYVMPSDTSLRTDVPLRVAGNASDGHPEHQHMSVGVDRSLQFAALGLLASVVSAATGRVHFDCLAVQNAYGRTGFETLQFSYIWLALTNILLGPLKC